MLFLLARFLAALPLDAPNRGAGFTTPCISVQVALLSGPHPRHAGVPPQGARDGPGESGSERTRCAMKCAPPSGLGSPCGRVEGRAQAASSTTDAPHPIESKRTIEVH